jgi:hypothetical protein
MTNSIYTNTFAAIRILGATKILNMREMRNGAIQVTYIKNGGKCSCFLSKKDFDRDLQESRERRSYNLSVTVLDDTRAIIENPVTKKYYVIEDGHCDCPDHTYRGVKCKHMMAFERSLEETLYTHNATAMLETELTAW